MKTGPIDYALIGLAVLQVVLVALRLTVVHLPWWLVFMPAFVAGGVLVVFLVCFGAFAYVMSKDG